jgi:hypothetical protein
MDRPLETLRALVDSHSSGEYIAVLESAEVHVYLKAGRVAWAIASDSPGTLMRHLAEECKLYRHELEAVVRDCRENRRPLGEGLIAWGFATQVQVRAALQKQIQEVFQRLALAGSAGVRVRSLFIPRSVEYAEELTFELSEVDDEEPASVAPISRSPRHLLRGLWKALPPVSWVQVQSPNGTTASSVAPGASLPEADIGEILPLSFGGELLRVTIRTRSGSIVGQCISDDGSTVWCGLDRTGNLGLVNAALASHASAPAPATASIKPRAYALEEVGSLPIARQNIESTFSDLPELLGVFATSAEEPGFAGIHRAPELLPRVARNLVFFDRMLELKVEDYFPRVEPVWESLTPEAISVLCEDAQYFYFGRRVEGSQGRPIWVVMQRSEARGLGWALLEALARTPSVPDKQVA